MHLACLVILSEERFGETTHSKVALQVPMVFFSNRQYQRWLHQKSPEASGAENNFLQQHHLW